MNQAVTQNLPAPPPTRQKKIPLETLLELAHPDKKLSCGQIGKIVGCTKQNIQARLDREGITTLGNHKKNRADILALKSAQIIQSIDLSTIKKASLQQRLTGYGILYDKERLERDLSTQNIQPMVSFAPREVVDCEVIAETDPPESPTSDDKDVVEGKV